MLVRDSLVYLIIRITSGALGLLSLIVFTNVLSTKDYGVYSFAVSLSSSFSAVFFGWISTSYARLHEEQTTDITISIIILYFKATIVIIFLLFLFYLFEKATKNQDTSLIFFVNIALISILLGYHTIALQKFNSNLKKKRYYYLNTSKIIFSLIFGLLLSPLGVNFAIFGTAIGTLISIIFFSEFKKSDFNFLNRDKLIEKKVLDFGFPLIVAATTTAILDNSDKLIISKILNWESVAYYSSAYNIAQQSTGMILSILYMSAYPHIIKSLSLNDFGLYKNRMKFLASFLFIGSITTTTIFYFFSVQIAELLFPAKISIEASKIMPWISLSIAIGCIKSYFLDIPLLIEKKTWLYTMTIITTAVSNVFFNFTLIPNFGILGGTYASLISYVIGSCVSLYFFIKHMNTQKIHRL
jgi:O-antigen/teichoic acid export membrane protein